MEDGIEKKILEEMCFRLVATKKELADFISEKNGAANAVDSITKSLVERGLLIKVYSATTSFAITQKGMKQSNL